METYVRTGVSFGALVCMLFLQFEAASARAGWATVAISGQVAPGTTLPFTSFGAPTLNLRGDIGFLGQVPQVDAGGNPVPCPRGGAACILTNQGVWLRPDGTNLGPLVVPGDVLPSASGPLLLAQSVVMNSGGTAAVLVEFSSGRGIYATTENGLYPVAVTDQSVGYSNLSFGRDIRGPSLSDSGEILFHAEFHDPATGARRVRHWVADEEHIQEGPPVVDYFGFSTNGQLAFSRVVIGEPFTYGVYLGDLHSQQIVLRSGQPAPGTGTIFGYPQRPSVNDYGQLAVHVGLGPTSGPITGAGIWTGDASGLVPVVLSGQVAPGMNAQFASFNRFPSINNSGEVAFSALIEGDDISSLNQQVLWKGAPGALTKVVQQGDPAPGTDVFFGRLALPDSDGFYYWHEESAPLAFNNRSQIAFIAQLTGPGVTADNDSGFWAESRSGELTLILREGDLISLGPDDVRQVSGFQLRFGGAYGNGFNDLGYIGMHVSFTDGSQAILVNHSLAVPEPKLAGFAWIVSWIAVMRHPSKSVSIRTSQLDDTVLPIGASAPACWMTCRS